MTLMRPSFRALPAICMSASVAFALLTTQVGCGPRQPPKLPVPAVKAVPVPMPAAPPPSPAPLFAYLKIRDLGRVMNLFGGEATLGMMAQAQGINLGEITPGQPLSLFLWDPDRVDTPFALPLAGLFPVPAEGTIAARLTRMNESLKADAWGTTTLIGMNSDAVDRAREQKDALLGLSGAATPFDALLYVHTDAIVAKYAPVLRQGIRAMQPVLTMTAGHQPGAPSPQSTMAMLEGVVSSLEQQRAAALGVSTYDGGVEVSTLIQEKPRAGNSTGEKGPIAAANLAQFLPPGDLRLVWNSRDIRRYIDFYLRVYGPILDERPELKTVVMNLVDQWVKVAQHTDSAMSFALGGDKIVTGHGILRVDNAAGALALTRSMVGLLQGGPVHDLYSRMGVDFQVVGKQAVRKIYGWPVDRYEYKIAVAQQVTEPTVRHLWERLNGMSYEVAQVGPYMLYSLNGSVDGLARSMFSVGAKPADGTSPPPILQAMASFPAGGSFYADVNVSSLLRSMRALLPEASRARLPELPPESGLLTLFGYDGGDVGYYKMRVPMTLILAIKSAADQVQRNESNRPHFRPGAPPN